MMLIEAVQVKSVLLKPRGIITMRTMLGPTTLDQAHSLATIHNHKPDFEKGTRRANSQSASHEKHHHLNFLD